MSNKVFKNDNVLEILISTMDKTSLLFLDSMFPNHDISKLNILIINQTNRDKELVSNLDNIRVINSFSRGLSLSRNLAIKNAIGDICLIADDDVVYESDFEKTIINSFLNLQQASIILFKIGTFTGQQYKLYPKSSKVLSNKKDIESSSSIEMAYRRKDVFENKIFFHPFFGLGSYFTSGEEYVFLKEAINKNLKVYFENITIVKHTYERSTSNIVSDEFIRAKAALYCLDYGNLSYAFLCKYILFLLRNNLMSTNDIFKKYKIGRLAIKDFKELKNAKY